MSTIINGSSPSITFSDSTTQASAGLPLTGGTLTGTTTFTGGIANANGFGVGTAVPSSGSGIAFPATQSASSDANTLDDYEEGTWTPTMSFGGGSTGLTYSVQSGNYTKVGNIVRVFGTIQLSNKGSSTGSMVITGLPFQAANSGITGSVLIGAWTGITSQIQYYMSASTSNVTFEFINSGTQSAVTNSNLVNNSSTYISLVYQVV